MIGIDIVKISRIERLLKKDKFLERIFTDREIELLKAKNMRPESVAGRFSAKESVSKALGTGIGKLAFKDIEILSDDMGKPVVTAPRGYDLEVSISHEKEYAISSAILKKTKYHGPRIGISLKPRPVDSHKGTFGRLAVVGASKGMSGSVVLSSKSALRTGSGLVYSLVPEEVRESIENKSLEAIVKAFPSEGGEFSSQGLDKLVAFCKLVDALAVGVGMGNSDHFDLIKNLVALGKPMVIDGDGLNSLKGRLGDIGFFGSTVLTPHPLEFARLTGLTVDQIQSQRKELASEFAKQHRLVLVLKGADTVVASPEEIYINKTGNSGMATAGSGDVLTGIIGSLLGQGYPAYEAACLGSFLHGRAGDLAAEEIGEDSLIASDLIHYLPGAILEKRIDDERQD